MEKEKRGRIVKVRTPYIGERSFYDEIYYAAIDDDIMACDKVREISGSSSDIDISVIDTLSHNTLIGLAMSDGECRLVK